MKHKTIIQTGFRRCFLFKFLLRLHIFFFCHPAIRYLKKIIIRIKRILLYRQLMYYEVLKKLYSFIKSQVTYRTCLQSKYRLYEIRPTGPARRLATRYVLERPRKKINRQRKLQLNTLYFLAWRHIMSWIYLVLVEIDPGVSRLGGEIASHNTTGARLRLDIQVSWEQIVDRLLKNLIKDYTYFRIQIFTQHAYIQNMTHCNSTPAELQFLTTPIHCRLSQWRCHVCFDE